MSYDLEIRSDASYSASVSLRTVTTILSLLPSICQTSESTFEFTLESLDIYAEIYCEYIDDQGESADLSMIQQDVEACLINCVRVCVPYAHIHRDKRDTVYVSLGGEIARKLSWKVVDLQKNGEQTNTDDLQTALKSLT